MNYCIDSEVEELLLSCSKADFGAVELSDGKKEFCNELNQEVISLCRTLPEATQTDALMLLMKCFRISMGQELAFFMNYYVPAWSIIYWLIQSVPEGNALNSEDILDAKTAHSMALLLHPIDDHLNDNELPATHLTLLIRSQLWMTMNNALNRLAGMVNGGTDIVAGFLNDYYSSIIKSQKHLSLTDYCERFKKQMSTGFIVPGLLMNKMGVDEQFSRAVQSAYAHFGIAWRLLDDINDIKDDMMKGTASAVYVCLSDEVKCHWDAEAEKKDGGVIRIIINHVRENRIVEKIETKISQGLKSAANDMDNYSMSGLADEFRSLVIPFENRNISK